MSDWLSYSLHDLLIFSPEAYAGLFESYNKALWPYQVPLVMASLVLLVGLRLKPAAFGKITLVSLALAWLFVGLWFIEGYYSQLNPMAESFIYFFLFRLFFCSGHQLIPIRKYLVIMIISIKSPFIILVG